MRTALNAYLAGQGRIDAVREGIVAALYDNLEYAEPILAMIRDAHASGKLSRAGRTQLVRDISRLTTEEISTQALHGKSGLSAELVDSRLENHRVVDEKDRTADSTAGAGARPTAPTPLAAGSVLLNRFELLECVKDHGMGRVFKARDRVKQAAGHPDALTAVKLLRPESGDSLPSLQKEALLAQTLNHPNIVNVFDLCRDADQYFITMEWLEGQSLAARLDATRGRPLPPEEARRILAGVAAALTFAHRKKIVHGDIKPGNVYITADGDVKLLDFGTARRIGDTPSIESDAVRAVTRGYASCELLEGKLPEVRDDIYALCCLWYRLITGVRPFGTRDALQAERDQARVKAPPGLTRPQWRALRAGLAFRRAQRPTDVAALTRSLLHKRPRAAKAKQLAAVLLFGGMAGAALWPYWPALAPWLDNLKSVEWNSGARNTDGPRATGQPQERDNMAATPATVGTTRLAPAASMTPSPAAPAGITADVPTDDRLAKAPSASPSAQETLTSLAKPGAEREPSPRPDPVQQTVSAPVASPQNDVAQTDVPTDDRLANAPSASPGAQETLTSLAEPGAEREPSPRPDPVQQAVSAPVASAQDDVAPADAPSFAPLGFRRDQYVVSESDTAVLLDIGYPRSLTAPVSLAVIIAPGTAKAYKDFVPASMPSIVVGPGEPAAKIILPVISDSVEEYTEDFLVRLVPDDPAVQIARPEAVIIILDDDAVDSVGSPNQNGGLQKAAE